MNYNKLNTKPFLTKNIKQNITCGILTEALKQAYINTKFSTFPYHFLNLNSRQSIKRFKEGNCIALAMYIKDYLRKKGFKSFLIPATIPYFIQHPDLLTVSHVALAIPKNKNNTFIVDPAFYFIKPIHIKHNLLNNKPINIMNFSDNGLEEISSKNLIYKQRKIYNQYQKVPKNTQICKCSNSKKSDIFWEYILREIINPDKSISSFFLQVKKDPFSLSTGYKNGRCTMKTEVNMFNDNKYIVISQNQQQVYSGNVLDVPQDKQHLIKDFFDKYK
jgi:hypothetical protein